MAKHAIQIRFNTEKEKIGAHLQSWRVIVDGEERLAEQIRIAVPSWTTEDIISTGQKKWHISCEGVPHWDEQGNCTITEDEKEL
jgi:hypothetical protein